MNICIDVKSAEIVYQNSWIGQTTSIPSTTVFTASSDGMYRVSVGTTASGSYPPGGAVYSVAIEPVSGQNVAPYDSISSSGIGGQAGVTVIALTSGQAIQFSATVSGSIASYNAYVLVEKLS